MAKFRAIKKTMKRLGLDLASKHEMQLWRIIQEGRGRRFKYRDEKYDRKLLNT